MDCILLEKNLNENSHHGVETYRLGITIKTREWPDKDLAHA